MIDYTNKVLVDFQKWLIEKKLYCWRIAELELRNRRSISVYDRTPFPPPLLGELLTISISIKILKTIYLIECSE